MPLQENPAPWVTKVLAKNFTEIANEVEPDWLPLQDRATARGKDLVVHIPEYGCGAYGCVMPTADADVVFKITTDSTEAEFVEAILPALQPPPEGFVVYHKTMLLRGTHKGSPLYAIWREEAYDVGKFDDHSSLRGDAREWQLTLFYAQKIAGDYAYFLLKFDENPAATYEAALALRAQAAKAELGTEIAAAISLYTRRSVNKEHVGNAAELARALTIHERSCRELQADPDLGHVATALLTCLANGVLIGDTHMGNIGRAEREGGKIWVITDPGHVAQLPEPWVGGGLLRNPTEELPSKEDLEAFLEVLVPLAVRYTADVCRSFKSCGLVSETVAQVARSEGFSCYIASVPGHFFNVFTLRGGGAMEVDVTKMQFALPYGSPRDTDDPEERALIDAAFERAKADPFSVVGIRLMSKAEYERIRPGLREPDAPLLGEAMTLAQLKRSVAIPNPADKPQVFEVVLDQERIDDMTDRADFFRDAAQTFNATAQGLATADGKPYVTDVLAAMGKTLDKIYARLLAHWEHLGWIKLTYRKPADADRQRAQQIKVRGRRAFNAVDVETAAVRRPAPPTAATMSPTSRTDAERVLVAARVLVGAGIGFGQMAYISDVALRLGTTVPALAPALLAWHRAGWVPLARADLVMEMPYEKVVASEITSGYARYNFIDTEAASSMAAAVDAARVQRVANELVAAGQGRGHKAFIGDVAAALGTTAAALGPSLVAWQRQGLIMMSRADIPAAMPPGKVAASTVRDLNSEFQFIEATTPRRNPVEIVEFDPDVLETMDERREVYAETAGKFMAAAAAVAARGGAVDGKVYLSDVVAEMGVRFDKRLAGHLAHWDRMGWFPLTYRVPQTGETKRAGDGVQLGPMNAVTVGAPPSAAGVPIMPRAPGASPLQPKDRDGARRVQQIANDLVAEGRGFGRKAYIVDIAAALGTTTSAIRTALLSYNLAGWIALARADLVGAMPREKVEGSEIVDAAATFHFVVAT